MFAEAEPLRLGESGGEGGETGGFIILGLKGKGWGGVGKAGLWAQGKLRGQRGGVGPHTPSQAFSYSPQETLARAQQELWVGPDLADSSRQLVPCKENRALRPGLKSQSALTSRATRGKENRSVSSAALNKGNDNILNAIELST